MLSKGMLSKGTDEYTAVREDAFQRINSINDAKARNLFFVILMTMDEDNIIECGMKDIQDEMGVKKKEAERLVKVLEEKGMISVERKEDEIVIEVDRELAVYGGKEYEYEYEATEEGKE